MRRQLIATTALIALAAILVLAIPLGLVESARARSDALGRLEREADGIAAAAAHGPDAEALAPWLRAGHAADVVKGGRRLRLGRMPGGARLATRSGATQGTRVTVYASAAEVTRRRRQVWLLVGVLAVLGTGAAPGPPGPPGGRFIP